MGSGRSPAVWWYAVTHEDIQAQVAPYAAGALRGTAAESVRTHLASGCPSCLRMLYSQRGVVARPGAAGEASGRRRWRAWIGGGVLGVMIGAIGAGAGGWSALRHGIDFRVCPRMAAEASPEVSASRAAEIDALVAQRRQLEAEQQRLEGEREKVQADLTRLQAEIAQERQQRLEAGTRATNEQAETEQRLLVLTRNLRLRDAELAHLRAAREADAALRELVTTPGLRVLSLRPAAGFREPHGHALLAPDSTIVSVYAEGLPRVNKGGVLRVRVRDGYGDLVGIVDGNLVDGIMYATVPLASHVSVAAIDVVGEPSGETILVGRLVPE